MPLDQEAVGLERARSVARGPGPRRRKRRLLLQADHGLHRADHERGREQTEVAEVIVRTVARAATVVGQRDVEVAGALRAIAVARLLLGAACVRAVVGARCRVRVRVTVIVIVAVRVVVIMVMTTVLEPDRLGVHMRAAAGIKRDADRVPGRHADQPLREQKEREHEAEEGVTHGAGGECSMYRPNRARGQGGPDLST